jgi:hypothetical protein
MQKGFNGSREALVLVRTCQTTISFYNLELLAFKSNTLRILLSEVKEIRVFKFHVVPLSSNSIRLIGAKRTYKFKVVLVALMNDLKIIQDIPMRMS